MNDSAKSAGVRRSYISFRSRESKTWNNPGIVVSLLAAFAAVASVGCGDGESTGFPYSAKARGALVSVDAGDTTVGFAFGNTRVTEKTPSFKISKHPITKKQYQECEKARICKAPKVEECSDAALARASFRGDDDSVAVCVGRENAQTYCKWAGGRLPTLAEWLRAARGPSVQKYPWGNQHASCAQHPKSVDAEPRYGGSGNENPSTEGCDSSQGAFVTKRHAAGASQSSGMQDILIAPAELLQGSGNNPYAACGRGQQCLVYGINPGSIDSVRPYTVGHAHAQNSGQVAQLRLFPEAYGFRCVIEK